MQGRRRPVHNHDGVGWYVGRRRENGAPKACLGVDRIRISDKQHRLVAEPNRVPASMIVAARDGSLQTASLSDHVHPSAIRVIADIRELALGPTRDTHPPGGMPTNHTPSSLLPIGSRMGIQGGSVGSSGGTPPRVRGIGKLQVEPSRLSSNPGGAHEVLTVNRKSIVDAPAQTR